MLGIAIATCYSTKTPMPEIEALIGVNQLEENGNLHHLGDACACAIEQLLKLNRVDDAQLLNQFHIY